MPVGPGIYLSVHVSMYLCIVYHVLCMSTCLFVLYYVYVYICVCIGLSVVLFCIFVFFVGLL